jgi:Na+/proline symporter
MLIWGLHIVDLGIILAFLLAVIIVGVRVSRGVKKESDFYLGGRKLGRVLQFFLNFGNATDSTGAVQISTEVFRQGIGGMWISFQTLFITPFFWFTQVWFRRARVITMADLFVDRFGSRSLASAYAAFNIIIALLTLGMGNLTTYKVTAAMMVKPESAYTAQERVQVNNYREYRDLKALKDANKLPSDEAERFATLDNMSKRGELRSFISYITPVPFYIAYSVIVGIYIILGGLKAAAIVNAVQGLLIIVMSVLLIPLGLNAVGGFAGLHNIVPAFKFRLFGTIATSEYTWYSIAAITFASLVQILGLMHNMAAGGSATNENTARFGMISGGFTKRLVLIAWGLCGLLAIAVFAKEGLADPDNAWGQLSIRLLMPGLMGLMLSGMMLGHMPAVGMAAVAVSALATRNLYQPLVKGRSPEHYMFFGQMAIAGILILAIAFALLFTGVIQMLAVVITFNTYFGAVVFLIFFWRRLTAPAIMTGLVVWVVLLGFVPWGLPHVPAFRSQPALLLQTPERHVEVTVGATAADVAAGKAQREGQPVTMPHTILPAACFFEKVARINPNDPNSLYEGIGRFNVESYLLYLVGVPIQRFSSSGLVAVRWGFDGVFPFLMLIAFSLVTKADPNRAPGFYAKMKTAIAPTPEEDQEQVQLSYTQPNRFDHLKLLPNSNWEFSKWTQQDVKGFGGCWIIVGLILLFLWGLLRLGGG